MQAGELVPHVDGGGIESGLGAEAHGELEAGGTEVDGDDLAMPAVDQGGDGGEPDGPTAEHGHPVAGLHVGLVGSLHPDGQRLGERGHVEGEIVGHGEQAGPGRRR